jgi:flavin reductase (DIM6/NTAB) family NADH-FMN oxidoreductase RutF
MSKIHLKTAHIKNILLPVQPILVGTTIKGKANYITIGMVGWMCYDTVSVSLGHGQFSNTGIQEHQTFSINQLSTDMVDKLDYCGIASGRNTDKSVLFDNFFGELKTAPMISECPVNLECRVIETLKRPVHTVYIGEIANVYVDDACLTNKAPDLKKIDPILFGPEAEKGRQAMSYYRLGESFAAAFDVGRQVGEKE